MNRPPEVTDLAEILANIARHEREKAEKAASLAALEKRLTPRVLARSPDAVQELAVARVAHQLADSAVGGAVQISRDVAARCVPYGFALEKRKRAICRENRSIIRDGITKRIARFYTSELLELVLVHATAAINEDMAEVAGPCAKGDPTSAELHPDERPEAVMAAIMALEAAIAAAEKRQAALKKEFN